MSELDLELSQIQADLPEIVGALRLTRSRASHLDGRHCDADQQSNDGDHDQQFNQRETRPLLTHLSSHLMMNIGINSAD